MAYRKLGKHEAAVVRSARAANLPPTDEAAILTARALARTIDDNPGDFDVIKLAAPRLMVILNGLGLSTAGRGVVRSKKGSGEVIPDDDSTAPDDELAAVRAKRGPGARRNAAKTRNATAG